MQGVFSVSWLKLTFIADASVIPGTVAAQVSVRIVPDQDVDHIVKSLCTHLKSSFESLQSPNQLKVIVTVFNVEWC